MWLKKIVDRGQSNGRAVKMMTPMQVVRGLRMRHYAWKKPLRLIADETGLSTDTIRAVISGSPFSIETCTILIGYLRTPQGPAALGKKPNRTRKEEKPVKFGPRRMLLKK